MTYVDWLALTGFSTMLLFATYVWWRVVDEVLEAGDRYMKLSRELGQRWPRIIAVLYIYAAMALTVVYAFGLAALVYMVFSANAVRKLVWYVSCGYPPG